MIERNLEQYLKVHLEERERATAHLLRVREARVARKARVAQESRVAADRPADSGLARILARFAHLRWGRPLRP